MLPGTKMEFADNVENQNITELVIHGERSSYQTQRNYFRYHLVIPTIPWEPLLMQNSACCNYFRTPVKFQDPDIYRIVGLINGQAYIKIVEWSFG